MTAHRVLSNSFTFDLKDSILLIDCKQYLIYYNILLLISVASLNHYVLVYHCKTALKRSILYKLLYK